MEERRAEERSAQCKAVRRGWCLGEDQFRRELLEQVHEKAGTHHYGEEISQSAEEKARRIIAEELAKLDWEEAELGRRRKTRRRENEDRAANAMENDGQQTMDCE